MKKSNLYKTAIACGTALIMSNSAVFAESCFGTAGYCVSDNNTQLNITSDGVMSFFIEGVQFAYTTDFVISNGSKKIKGKTPTPLSMRDYIDFNQQPATASYSQLSLTDMPVSNWGSANYDVQVVSYAVDFNTVELIHTYTITNVSSSAVNINLFAYSDIDLNGAFGNELDDQGELYLLGPVGYRQFDDTKQVITSVNIQPDYYEVNYASECINDMCARIYTDTSTVLTGTIAPGPWDLENAAQWVRQLEPGNTFTVTQTMTFSDLEIVDPGTNQLPIADAGPDSSQTSKQTVTLDGQLSSDPDGQIVSYQWNQTFGKKVELINADQAVASFVTSRIKRNSTETLAFELTVTDNNNATSSDSVTVTVSN